jgi:hypothetical protein
MKCEGATLFPLPSDNLERFALVLPPRKNQKKLAFSFVFVLLSFLKKKQFPIISPFKSRKSLMRK